MRPPRPLPDVLRERAFDRSAATRAGESADRLRSRDLFRPFHGVRTHRPPTTLLDRCHAYAARMKPGQFFSHTTALRLQGYSVPTDLLDEQVLHVAAEKPADAPHTTGVAGHRLVGVLPAGLVSGLPVADPLDAFCQVGSMLSQEDLVVIADELLNSSDLDESEAKRAIVGHIAFQRRVGAVKLARAADLARRGSRSPAETRVRLVLDAACIPAAELNAPITERGTGRYLGSPDFVWRTQRVALEYEGDDHRERERFRRDIVRYDDLTADGWRIVRATGDDLSRSGRPALVRRVQRALASG